MSSLRSSIDRAQDALLPLYVVFVVLTGGTERDVPLLNGVQQGLGGLLIALACFDTRNSDLSRLTKWGFRLSACILVVAALSLLPLPASVWVHLPGRAQIPTAFALVSATPLPWLPVSLAPQETLEALLRLLPPIAVFLLTACRLSWSRNTLILWLILGLASASVGLAVVQFIAGADSRLYPWLISNRGSAVGFMANANHQAILALMAVPFAIAGAARVRLSPRLVDRNAVQAIVIGSALLFLIAGVLLTGSASGLLFLGPVIAASVLSIILNSVRMKHLLWSVLGLACLGGIGLLGASSSAFSSISISSLGDSAFGRAEIWSRTVDGIVAGFPVGTGLGSFASVYPLYEDPASVTSIYVNHAHNDYLEILLELGLLGAIGLSALLAWTFLLVRTPFVVESGDRVRLGRAAALAVLIPILHSLIDYPLRTPSVACLFALCLGILAGHARRPTHRGGAEPQGSTSRHVTL